MSGVGWGDVAVGPNGLLTMCSSTSDSAALQFGRSRISISEPGRDIRAVYAFGHVYGVVKGQDTGKCLVARDDGLTVILGPTYGNQCVGLFATDTELWAVYVTSASQWVQYPLSPRLVSQSPIYRTLPGEIMGTSQGFLALSLTGDPVWTDLHRTITLPNGVMLVLWMQFGNWIIGQGLVAPAQVSAWDGGTMFTVWEGATAFPPRIGVGTSGPLVAIASSTPVFVPGPFAPYHVAPDPSPVPIPSPAPGPVPVPTPPVPPPIPAPLPEPLPIEDSDMKIGDTIQFRRDDTGEPWQFGTLTVHNDGDPYLGIAVTDWFGVAAAGFASLMPDGHWQAPAPAPQGWERFIPAGASLMAAPRSGGPGGVLTVVNTQGKTQ